MKNTKLPDKFAYWHGIERTKIPWYPTINEEKCIGCKLCFVSCGRNVFDFDIEKNKVIVENKYNCMVGCSTCAAICPVEAINFPDKEIVQKIEREEKILLKIQKKAKEKKIKKDLEKIRKEVLNNLANIKTSVEYEIAGHILEKEIFKNIHKSIKNCAVDLVEISLEIPSLKGCWEFKAPSHAKFKLISTEMNDIQKCEKLIDTILEKNNIILVNKN